jgi:hypothetical protein
MVILDISRGLLTLQGLLVTQFSGPFCLKLIQFPEKKHLLLMFLPGVK